METETLEAIPWDAMEEALPGCLRGVARDNLKGRAGTLALAMSNGATVAELATIAAADYASRGDTVRVPTRYGHLSRGKAWARQGSGSAVTWAEKRGGTVYLTPGTWTVGSDDGYSRRERVTIRVSRVAGVLIAS